MGEKKRILFRAISLDELDEDGAEDFKKDHIQETLGRSWWEDEANSIDFDFRDVTTITKDWLQKTLETYFHAHDDSRDVLSRMRFIEASEDNQRVITEWLFDCFGLGPEELGVKFYSLGPTGQVE